MKISHKLTLIFLGISLIPLTILSSYSFTEFEDNIMLEQKSKLDSIINSEESDINHLVQLRHEQAKMIAGTFLPRQLDPNGNNSLEDIEKIQVHIDSILEEMTLDPTSDYNVIDSKTAIEIIGIWDINGVIVANTQNDLVGGRMPMAYLEQVKEHGTYFGGFQKDPLTDRNFLVILEGIRNWENDEFAGVVLFKIRAEILNDITGQLGKDSGGSESTGELYLVNRDYFLITESRFTSDAILQENAKSKVVVDCFENITTFGKYTNFRGDIVIGHTKYLPDQNWCLVGEISLEEALLPVTNLRNNIIYASLAITSSVILSAIVFSGRISKPILQLKDLAVKISDGDLDAKVSIQSRDEIGQLSKMMNETGSKLKKAQKEKEEVVAMITHDLKQPLVPIKGNAELLKMPDMGELNEMQRECIDEIAANASRQLSMIDNLVSAQKLGAGAMTYDIEELSSKDILNECIRVHTPIMQDKDIEYIDTSTEDIKIKGDKRRILEAYTNLIQNGHDFVPKNGKIEIGVTDGEKEVTFFVKDNGEGIPKEKQDKLFKKYGQVKSDAKRKFGGTGLGLAVSQELIEGMGGKIWLESEEGKGANFLFTIPKA